MTDDSSSETQRQDHVEVFVDLWDSIGGAEFAAAATSDELIERATEHGANDKQISSFLMMQETFKEIDEGVERMQDDATYANHVKKEAEEFDWLVERASQPKTGIIYTLGRLLGRLR